MSANIMEITQMIQNKESLQNDLSEAMNLVKNMFHEKYIQKIHSAVDEYNEVVHSNPPREIQLLQALKPFMAETTHPAFDQIIDMMYMVNTAQSLQNEMSTALKKDIRAMSDIVKEDGVYEIDENCVKTKGVSPSSTFNPPILLILLFFLFSGFKI